MCMNLTYIILSKRQNREQIGYSNYSKLKREQGKLSSAIRIQDMCSWEKVWGFWGQSGGFV